ncbi:T9SS type A sorting domain-containing protein [Winogradskyella sp. 3972H.M.0a.05]|uniref:T9SS type A sorting domain-containing protein n=1 Tax=Winogradskyella sp. 3972H.M.0a.05 TaxID=2950277 RepID=UPI0033994A58
MKNTLLILIAAIISLGANSQQFSINSDGEFFLSSDVSFTTSGIPLKQNGTGIVIIEAGNTWSANSNEYVDGKVIIKGLGTTLVNAGNEVNSSPFAITTAIGDEVEVEYTQDTPPYGDTSSLGTYSLSDVEYWTVTKLEGNSADFDASGFSETIGATYNGESSLNTPIVVRLESGSWVPYTENPGFGTFALAAKTETLSITDNSLSSDDFVVFESSPESIKVKVPNTISNLDISIYDTLGRLAADYSNIRPHSISDEVYLTNHNLQDGVYIMHFYAKDESLRFSKKVIIR